LRAIQEEKTNQHAILEKCDKRYFEIAGENEDFLFDFIISNMDEKSFGENNSRPGVNCCAYVFR
jgi:hypothetical protein